MLVPQKGFTVYTKSRCPYCDKVKILLQQQQQQKPVHFVNCDDLLAEPHKKEALLKQFQEWANGTAVKTFPVVFLDGIFIGGFTNTQTLLEKEAI